MNEPINGGEMGGGTVATNRERFYIGGVGGLMPVLVFLATGDFTRFFTHGYAATIAGYCVRAIILFFIGGFVVCLYRDENNRFKMFHLGLAAPAMIAGLIAAQSSPVPAPASASASVPGPNSALETGFIVAVYAQSSSNDDGLKRFTLPIPSPTAQFLEGLIGIPPKNVWFVVTGSYLSVDRAKASAKKINDTFHDFHADVYAPYGDNPNYAVVIGANLTQPEASALRNKAVSAGLSKDTYYKTFPNLPPP